MVQSYFQIQLTDSGQFINQSISREACMTSAQGEGDWLDDDIF